MSAHPYRAWCAELAADLRRPIDPAEVRFKIAQLLGEEAAQVVAYVESRVVIARLNLLVPGRWRATHRALSAEMRPQGAADAQGPLYYECRLEVAGALFEDVGEGEEPKAAYADSLKRAAVRAGIGECLYALRIPPLRVGQGEGQLRTNRKGRPYLDRNAERWLRALYERWLSERGIGAFGAPLAHGPEPEASSDAGAGPVELEPPADGADGVVVRIGAANAGEMDAAEAEPAAPAGIEAVAAAAAALSGGLDAPALARLGVLLAGAEPAEAGAPLLTAALAAELVSVLGLAHAARWSGARLEEVTERALAAARAPHERRLAFLAHLEQAAEKARGAAAA